MRAADRPHLSYFYDLPLPNEQAAGIQIVRTARALCERGAAVTLLFGPVKSEAAVHAHYGITPHPRLRIESVFGPGISSREFRQRLRRLFDGWAAAPKHVIIGRGESGLGVFEEARRVVAPPNVRFLWEAHRTCASQAEAFFHPRVARRWRLRRHVRRIAEREQAALDLAHGMVCVTDGVADALRADYEVPRQTLILPGGTEVRDDPLPSDADRDIDVLYVGKLQGRKGVPDLIDAMPRLPGVRLWLVGGDDESVAAMRQRGRALGVHDRLRFEGYVPPSAVRRYLRRARVGVCPLPQGVSEIADRFTCPLKILEMMAVGTPIVTTDTAAVRRIVTHDRTAWLVEPNDPMALAHGIRTLLERRPLANRLAIEARKAAVAFGWDRRAERFLEFATTLEPGGS